MSATEPAVVADETPQEWAQRALREHGEIPEHLMQRVRDRIEKVRRSA